MPVRVTVIPSQFIGVSVSPRTSQPINAANGGASAITSIDMRAPITTSAWNSRRSPMTNPINPESASHCQLNNVASDGKKYPRTIQL